MQPVSGMKWVGLIVIVKVDTELVVLGEHESPTT